MSVRLLQTGIVSKRLDESSWVLAWWLYFTYLTLYFKENMGISKIRVLPSRALSETSQSENFPAASLSRCQQNSSSSTVELVDNTYTTIDDESWLFTTCRPTVTLWLRCCDFLWIRRTIVSTVDKILTDSASRGPSTVAELLTDSFKGLNRTR